MHTLAFNEPLKGLTADELRYAAAEPAVDPASSTRRKRLTTESPTSTTGLRRPCGSWPRPT